MKSRILVVDDDPAITRLVQRMLTDEGHNVEVARSLIQLLGIEPQRLRLEWISAAEGARFAEVVVEFTDQVRELGANRLGDSPGQGATVS